MSIQYDVRTGVGHSIETIDISSADHNLAVGVRLIAATGGGVVKVEMIDGTIGLYPIQANGSIGGQFVKVIKVGTTAAGMVAIR